ncbi:MAG: sulfur carrier protein ThiS adenylyltransferase ThiF [Elusimicrobia bacterium]|nr:sulfur carrier protein ThiS adenylyltransferase ThiF [Elusimicrobiota bacterium]
MAIFARNVPGMTEALRRRVVGVAGCGGLGSNAAVALVRAGVGELILADFDVVEESNLNRQAYERPDIGAEKVRALARHLRAINPAVRISEHVCRIVPGNVAELFGRADLLIEAFDQADAKKWLIESWCRAFPGKDIICGNGLSGCGRTEDLKVVQVGAHLWFCGDGGSELSLGLCSARVAIVANMQANLAIERLMRP